MVALQSDRESRNRKELTKLMNTYLVKLTIYTGGYEKTTIHLIDAPNATQAGRKAMEDESHDPDSLEFEGDNRAEDMGGEFVYEVHSADEVHWKDAVTLRKYI